ncbi:MAG: hypothetical protein AKCLJLPJ_02264 [Fimbriimonadales bacterium]|nr:hypothetical protein [Fimbriimonadales bacterium]
MLAMNIGDSADTIKKYFGENGFELTPLMAPTEVHKKFGIQAYPSNYVVDSKGVVLDRMCGFDEARIRKTLKAKGIAVK